jgi:hypothetical protein
MKNELCIFFSTFSLFFLVQGLIFFRKTGGVDVFNFFLNFKNFKNFNFRRMFQFGGTVMLYRNRFFSFGGSSKVLA